MKDEGMTRRKMNDRNKEDDREKQTDDRMMGSTFKSQNVSLVEWSFKYGLG